MGRTRNPKKFFDDSSEEVEADHPQDNAVSEGGDEELDIPRPNAEDDPLSEKEEEEEEDQDGGEDGNDDDACLAQQLPYVLPPLPKKPVIGTKLPKPYSGKGLVTLPKSFNCRIIQEECSYQIQQHHPYDNAEDET
jgi:hypothetical protein